MAVSRIARYPYAAVAELLINFLGQFSLPRSQRCTIFTLYGSDDVSPSKETPFGGYNDGHILEKICP